MTRRARAGFCMPRGARLVGGGAGPTGSAPFRTLPARAPFRPLPAECPRQAGPRAAGPSRLHPPPPPGAVAVLQPLSPFCASRPTAGQCFRPARPARRERSIAAAGMGWGGVACVLGRGAAAGADRYVTGPRPGPGPGKPGPGPGKGNGGWGRRCLRRCGGRCPRAGGCAAAPPRSRVARICCARAVPVRAARLRRAERGSAQRSRGAWTERRWRREGHRPLRWPRALHASLRQCLLVRARLSARAGENLLLFGVKCMGTAVLVRAPAHMRRTRGGRRAPLAQRELSRRDWTTRALGRIIDTSAQPLPLALPSSLSSLHTLVQVTDVSLRQLLDSLDCAKGKRRGKPGH